MWFYYDVDDFNWTKEDLIDAHENLLTDKEVVRLLANHNDEWDTNFMSVEDFNNGEEFRKIISWEEFITKVLEN